MDDFRTEKQHQNNGQALCEKIRIFVYLKCPQKRFKLGIVNIQIMNYNIFRKKQEVA